MKTTMCGEMVTMHQGISEEKLMAAAARFFRNKFFVEQIFPEMRELVRRLRENLAAPCGCFFFERVGDPRSMKYFGIPETRILAAKVEVE